MSNFFKNRRLIRYLIVGVWNTVFGYAIYAYLTYILDGYMVKFSYMYAHILSYMIGTTQSFLMHKYIVFRSKGNFWKEYKRSLIVYFSMSLLSLILLPLFVYLSEKILPDEYKMLDKYIAGIISAGVTATVGFFGNKKITFKQ